MLSFFPRGVLDEILNLIESVSEGFPFYSSMCIRFRRNEPIIARLIFSAVRKIAILKIWFLLM